MFEKSILRKFKAVTSEARSQVQINSGGWKTGKPTAPTIKTQEAMELTERIRLKEELSTFFSVSSSKKAEKIKRWLATSQLCILAVGPQLFCYMHFHFYKIGFQLKVSENSERGNC